jgi:hypothetical protein
MWALNKPVVTSGNEPQPAWTWELGMSILNEEFVGCGSSYLNIEFYTGVDKSLVCLLQTRACCFT